MQSVLIFLITILQIITYGSLLYHFLVSFFAWIEKPKKNPIRKDPCSFAVVISAYNEENVISETLKSIYRNNYSRDLYDVFVIADNCTDNTAQIAKETGAVVWERTDPKHRGKGYALSYAFERIFSNGKNYDAVCIIDADNILCENFLKEISNSLNYGYDAVQGYIDAKNPFDSWVSASYYITLLCINKMYQKARHNIGFPVQLNGTGFAVRTEILKNIKWDSACLTEDIEITVKLACQNSFAAYNENAVVYDEKPLDFATSFKQRTRWMQGQSDVLGRYFLTLIKATKSISPLKAADCIIYLMQPLIFILTGIITVLGIIQFFVPDFKFMLFSYTDIYTCIGISVIQFLSIPVYLFIINKFDKRMMKYYIPYLIFMYSWIPVSFMGIIKRKNKIWFHTKHTVCVTTQNK